MSIATDSLKQRRRRRPEKGVAAAWALRRAASRIFAAALLAVAWSWQPAPAQGPAGAARRGVSPMGDPSEWFDRFFGQETEADRRALAQIEVSLPEERAWGERAFRAYAEDLKRRRIALLARGRDLAYLKQLVAAVHPFLRHRDRYRSVKIYLAESPEVEARSFPGGILVFYRGLLDAAGSEAALVGVIGHELSHLDRGHQLDRLRRIKLAQRSFSPGSSPMSTSRFFAAGAAMMRMFTRPFRPEDEAEADRDGAAWAYRAGYDPREMARLFRKLKQQGGGVPLPALLRSHPAPGDRYQAVMKQYERLQQENPKASLYIGRENLRRRTTRRQQRFPDGAVGEPNGPRRP